MIHMTSNQLPTITALDMLHAQGWKPTADERSAIVAKADFFEANGLSRTVNLSVVDVYTGTKIGQLAFHA